MPSIVPFSSFIFVVLCPYPHLGNVRVIRAHVISISAMLAGNVECQIKPSSAEEATRTISYCGEVLVKCARDGGNSVVSPEPTWSLSGSTHYVKHSERSSHGLDVVFWM